MALVSLAVYVAPAVRSAVGFRIHWFPVPGSTAAATAVPAGSVRVNVVPFTPVTGSLKVAVTFVPAGMFVAPLAGARVAVGGTVSPAGAATVKLHVAPA